MSGLEYYDWQKNLGRDVAKKVRDDLDSGRVPWIAYSASDLEGRLVREYRDGSPYFSDCVSDGRKRPAALHTDTQDGMKHFTL